MMEFECLSTLIRVTHKSSRGFVVVVGDINYSSKLSFPDFSGR